MILGYDDETLEELSQQFKDTLKELTLVPLKITYTDYSGCKFDSFEQKFTEGTPTPITLHKKCFIKQGKNIGEDSSTLIFASIPLGKYGVFLPYEDRLQLKNLDSKTINSLAFEIYYETENPVKLNPEEKSSVIQYFMNHQDYPVYQMFICGVDR